MSNKVDKNKNKSALETVKGWFSKSNKQLPTTKAKKSFEGGQHTRLVGGWGSYGSNVTLDRQIYNNMYTLRDRARDLSLNNDYVKKYLDLLSNNVVGPNGFTIKVTGADYDPKTKSMIPDHDGNLLVRNAFYEWCEKEYCEVTGKYSFISLCKLIVETLARDGESLVRRIRQKGINKFGYTLQILDIDRLDHLKNEVLANGNIIKMGVELNPYGKPVAYHIRKFKTNDVNYVASVNSDEFERISANEIFHIFLNKRAEQTRGFTWLHSVLINLKMLDSYQEAALVAARVGAAKMGFFTSNNQNPDGSDLADGEDDIGNLIMNADAGVFSILPQGYDFKSFSPDYPAGDYAVFIKSNLRAIASGLSISYNNLASDLEGVNFSSMRVGANEERTMFESVQNFFKEAVLETVYKDWIETSLLNGAIKFPNGSPLPIAKIDKFSSHQWIGRKWAFIDPAKDIASKLAAVNGGLYSRSQVIAEMGGDIEEVFAQLAHEKEMGDKLGLNLANIDSIYAQEQLDAVIQADEQKLEESNHAKEATAEK